MASKCRILVVEDDRDTGEVLAKFLESQGYDVRFVDNGEAAIAAFPEFRPQCVLLDLQMPALDGLQTGQTIRSLPGGNRVRLIALTGYGREQDRLAAKTAGFEAYFLKPCELGLLMAAIDGDCGEARL